VAGLGSKMGLDATNKWPGETIANGVLIVVLGLWVAYRVIRGWLALADRRPVGTS
jgi:3-polyprenyl-4-hydroxybenzoate decarboxylase